MSRSAKHRRPIRYRGRELGTEDVVRIRQVVRRHCDDGRIELARRVCQLFDWRRSNGEYATRSGLDLLLRMERHGWVQLPATGRTTRPRQRDEGLDALCLEPAPGWENHVARGELMVRLIVAEELRGWRAYMQRFHYLGDRTLVGESLRYAAMVGGELVALLSWSGATLHNSPRDVYVGWDSAIKRKNLAGVVNNTRFLILPWIRQPNLASRILSTNLRRLGADWQARYHHPVWLAETFVDTARFFGGCYRASNWIYVGHTKGWCKQGSSYSYHGQQKAVFVYPLVRNAILRLTTPPVEPQGKDDAMMLPQPTEAVTFDFSAIGLEGETGLFSILKGMTDFRKARGKLHKMESIVAIALCATLAGAKSFVAISDWAKDQSIEDLKRLGSKYGKAPSERTIRRVLQKVNVQEIDEKTGAWVARHTKLAPGKAIALDGKTLRGTGHGQKAAHLLSAIVHGGSEVVAQTPVGDKTNEIPCVEPLLRNLDIKGCVVTADALHTQKATASLLVEGKQADYLFTVKDNQPTLRQDIDALHMEGFPPSGGDD